LPAGEPRLPNICDSAIAGSGFRSLTEGAKVEYEAEQGPLLPNV
jgi:cold shock CspA family protein